jgi:hypothetical protein
MGILILSILLAMIYLGLMTRPLHDTLNTR